MVCVSPNQFDGAHKRPLALRHELRTMVQSPAHVGATPACDRLPSRFIGSQKCNPCAWELLLPMSVEHTMSSPSPGGEGRGEGESTTINPLRVSMSRSMLIRERVWGGEELWHAQKVRTRPSTLDARPLY
jgi:hypothetical protein